MLAELKLRSCCWFGAAGLEGTDAKDGGAFVQSESWLEGGRCWLVVAWLEDEVGTAEDSCRACPTGCPKPWLGGCVRTGWLCIGGRIGAVEPPEDPPSTYIPLVSL